ncbi:hypothetical protein DKX38_017236 [Salix brachista]|uniref:Protein kinase domain-containing protein n=1 Tax=Salix brachista TaxID=2182728 RepID=A0A5N5KUM5_9ROSI|nr:hypothetical protein DKX38_017236 [Salix brachista]
MLTCLTFEVANNIEGAESLQFAFSTIQDATEDFSEKNRLGQGGFGVVYKGVLPNGQEIAVKRLSKDSGQGDLEFKNEVLLLAKLQHRNLVMLLGFCLEGIERLLIYEFVPNSSLDHFIFDPTKRVQLNWERCYKIIGGIARGLLYLHEDSRLRIIHRDLKASNILLDEEMNPKISDFGMACGYMAPEYALQGNFSVKLDVFSFGVLVLEIVTGKKNSFRNGEHIKHLLSHAWRNWREGTAQDIIDPVLSSGSATEMMRCIHIGLLCVQENAANRPTMASVVLMLSSSSLTLQIPSQPAFFMSNQSDMSSSLGQNSRVTDQSSLSKSEHIPLSRNDVSIYELMAESVPSMADSSAAASVQIVYTKRPQDEELEAYHIRTLASVLGSEDAAKEALLYSYNKVANGFSAKLTPQQAEQISSVHNVKLIGVYDGWHHMENIFFLE